MSKQPKQDWRELLRTFRTQRRTLRVRARHVRAGDFIVTPAGHTCEVAAVATNLKQSPAHVLFALKDASLSMTYFHDEEVTIERMGLPPAGLYELRRTLENPYYDLRRAHWAFRPTLPACRYVLYAVGHPDKPTITDEYDGAPAMRAAIMRTGGPSEPIGISVLKEMQIFSLLAEHLQPAGTELDSLWLRLNWITERSVQLRAFLTWQVQTGALTLDAVKQLCTSFNERNKS